MIWNRDLKIGEEELTREEAVSLIQSRINWLRDNFWNDGDIPKRMDYWDNVILWLNQMRNDDLKYAYYKIAKIDLRKEEK